MGKGFKIHAFRELIYGQWGHKCSLKFLINLSMPAMTPCICDRKKSMPALQRLCSEAADSREVKKEYGLRLKLELQSATGDESGQWRKAAVCKSEENSEFGRREVRRFAQTEHDCLPIESAIVLRFSPENSRLNGLPTGAALAPGQPAQGGWMWAKLEGHKIRMWLVDKASLSIPFIPLCGKFSYMHAS